MVFSCGFALFFQSEYGENKIVIQFFQFVQIGSIDVFVPGGNGINHAYTVKKLGNQRRCIQVVVHGLEAFFCQFVHIDRILVRGFQTVQHLYSCHQPFVSFFGGLQGFVGEVERTSVMCLKDKEPDCHGGVGLLQHVVFTGKQLV